ncbi:MAG TPA: PDZ domain-containing protein [Verrucomicrobiae bacterium]|jgi:C-terminal processing protease CtpA/Prc|nr:PDZ domain-containing protein [Verrucomicrobiae bacterium]
MTNFVAKELRIAAVAGVALVVLWVGRSCITGKPSATGFKNTIQSMAAHPFEFARNQFTGGVGVTLGMDSATGLPAVETVLVGSPADRAGLRSGDVITHVNGSAMTGKKMADVVEAIRGFSAGSVTITVLRRQTRQPRLEFTIRRNSMNSLLRHTLSTN